MASKKYTISNFSIVIIYQSYWTNESVNAGCIEKRVVNNLVKFGIENKIIQIPTNSNFILILIMCSALV